MNEHPGYLVYLHIGRFLESRGLAPVPGAELDIPRDRFVTELNQIGYFRLDAEGPPARGRRVVTILILAPRGKFTDHGPQLRNLVSSLDSEGFAREGRLAEVLVVVPEEVTRKKNMTDVIQAFQKDGERGAEHYNMYPYHVLSLDVPRARCVPRHEIADPAEVRAFLSRERLTLPDLRRVAASNPPVVWIGARPGQVVRILSPSETAGETYNYCLVSNA